jgi:epsilon-lactone hydrolase
MRARLRTHRKLRDAGKGLSHAQYLFDPAMPESKQHFADVGALFDRHLEK